MHNVFCLQNQCYFPSTQGTVLLFIIGFILPKSLFTGQKKKITFSSLGLPFCISEELSKAKDTYKYACTHCLIRMGDNCHFPVCILLSKYNKQLGASEVWCGENVVFVCISKRPEVNVTIWGTAGTVLELSVSQPGCLLRPLFLPLVRYDTDSYFWTAFSPLCIHSRLLIWFLITIYGRCCSMVLTWG